MKLTVLCVFMLPLFVYSSIEISRDDRREEQFFANLLAKLTDYQIIFHADPNSIDTVNNIVRLLRMAKPTSVVIYHHKFDVIFNILRPNIFKLVTVLFTNNTDVWRSLSTAENIKYRDIVVFIGMDTLKKQIIEEGLQFLKLAGEILFVDNSNINIPIYKICYYCGDKSMKFFLVENTTSNEIKTASKDLLPSNFRDMNGHLLHVVYVQYFPFVYCKTNRNATAIVDGKVLNVCLDIRGIESYFMITMSKKLNFTFVVHILDASFSFFNMIEYINQRKADIAFGGISITTDRIPLVQFTKQYNTEDYHFMYVLNLSYQEMMDKFMEPFKSTLVWGLYLASFAAISICLFSALKISKKSNTKSNYPDKTLIAVFWALFHSFVEQGYSDITSLFRLRFNTGMLLGLWWWVSLILCNFYKSTVLSTMVYPPNTEPDDIEQLVRSGYRFAGSKQYADIIKGLLSAPDPLYAEALAKTMYGEDACDVLRMILPGKVAMLDEISELQYELRTICASPNNSVEIFRIARTPVRATGHGWATQIGAPYRYAMDYYMSLILSGGFFKKWTKDVTAKLAADHIPKSREIQTKDAKPLSFKRFMPLLTVYTIGIIISVSCFVLEFILYYVQKLYKAQKKRKFKQKRTTNILLSWE